ncbi:MAG: cyclophane-forming radical SAM/SPASM peptide maturase GrrM/OscB [Stellaceae bacterium]
MPVIDLLVVQPTPFCNIDCKYCYLPGRNSKAVLTPQTLCNLFSQVFASGWVDGRLSVVWHAGEPMVLPISFYREAFAMIEALRPRDVTVVHSFQTNGTLIDAAWCSFFAEVPINLGVSIDGPQHLHDRNRVTRAGRGTFERTIAGIRLLRRHAVPFHVISVLSSASMAVPAQMFDFYVAEGIEEVCFNVEESEGDHISEAFGERDVETAFSRFLSEFWRLSAASPRKITFLREIEQALQQVIRPREAVFRNQLVEPFAITSMDWAGNISTFSPELLGLKNPAYDDFILGNINRDALTDLPHCPAFARMLADIDAGVAMCREACEYFSVCGGGEPVNKLAENGTFASTETTYCRLTRMRVTDLVLDALERGPAAGVDSAETVQKQYPTAGRPSVSLSVDEARESGGQDEQNIAVAEPASARCRCADRVCDNGVGPTGRECLQQSAGRERQRTARGLWSRRRPVGLCPADGD